MAFVISIILTLTVLVKRTEGSCLIYQPTAGANLIFGDFNATSCKHLEAGQTASVKTINANIDPDCIPDVRSHVNLEVLLSGREDCLHLDFVFMYDNETSCKMRVLVKCHGQMQFQTEDLTTCVVNCPKKLNAENKYELEIISGLGPRTWDLCGVRIQDDIDECASSPCQNGGTCVNELNKYTCECQFGFDGVLCQTGEGYFELLSAVLGFTNMCVSINNGNRTGWYKRHLNVSVEECMQRAEICEGCANRAATANTFNYGDGQCLLRHCENGLHITRINRGFSVYIKAGYPGLNANCNNSSCLNGGTCLATSDGYNCACAENYGGDHCQIAN